jgi:predicted nucleic acid-binding protein
MREYILDIDHLAELMGGNEVLLKRMGEIKKDNARFGITVTILSELYFMLRASAQMDTNMASLTELVSDLYVWGFDRGAAEITGEIMNQQRSLNRPINPTEAQIVAIARQRQAILLSSAEHFSDVRDIELQNWLKAAP